MTFEQAAVLTLQHAVGSHSSDGVGDFQFYFPDVSEQLTEEEIEALLQDEQIQQDAGVGICNFCGKFEYLANLYEPAMQHNKRMCYDCGGGC